MDYSKYENKLSFLNWREIYAELIKDVDSTPLTKAERTAAEQEAIWRAKSIAKQERDAYNAEDGRLKELFEKDTAEDIGFDHLPIHIKQMVCSYAWERGSGSGYSEVYNCACDIAPVVIAAYEAGKKELIDG